MRLLPLVVSTPETAVQVLLVVPFNQSLNAPEAEGLAVKVTVLPAVKSVQGLVVQVVVPSVALNDPGPVVTTVKAGSGSNKAVTVVPPLILAIIFLGSAGVAESG